MDEVEQLHRRRKGVAAGDAYNKPKVCSDEPILRPGCLACGATELRRAFARVDSLLGVSALFDDLAKFAFLVCGEQRDEPDFVEILTY